MEKANNAKRAGATLLATAVAISGAAAGAAAVADDGLAYAAPAGVEEQAAAAAHEAGVRAVTGTFEFTQDKVTSTAAISGVFNKAASVLCAKMPEYTADALQATVKLASPEASMEVALEDVEGDDEAPVVRMGCACSSNVAGGGAIMNADISGVPLSVLADIVRATR